MFLRKLASDYNKNSSIDWHNVVGGKLMDNYQEGKNFTKKDWIVRFGHLSFAALCFFIAKYSCDNDQDCSANLRGLLGSISGLFISHLLTVTPAIIRRQAIINDTKTIYENINIIIQLLHKQSYRDEIMQKYYTNIIDNINYVSKYYMELDYPTYKVGDLDKNIIKKKNILFNLFNEANQFHEFIIRTRQLTSNDLNFYRIQWEGKLKQIHDTVQDQVLSKDIKLM